MWLLNGCKDSFDMFCEVKGHKTQQRKKRVISNIVDWILRSNEEIQGNANLRKNVKRFREALRGPRPSQAEIPSLKSKSDMVCFTRVKNACVYFNGTKSEHASKTNFQESEKFIDRNLRRPAFFVRKDDIIKQENWLRRYLGSLCCNGSGNSRDGTQGDFGDFEALDEEYA